MDYKEEDREDKKYKKGYSKKEFKKDVAEAVEPVVMKGKKKKPKKAKRQASEGAKRLAVYPTKRSSYAKMSATELRKLLNTKKKALLKKAGFPEGGIPRSKEAMVTLCMRLKRKKW